MKKKSNDKMNRRDFIGTAAKAGALASGLAFPNISLGQSSPPNFLMIPVDDLNDWIAPLGGYAGVITPNFTRLANMARNYRNASSNVPACSPSRTATLFGMHPVTTGVYTNDEEWQHNNFLANYQSLPKFLKNNGYLTYGTGKIFHSFEEGDEEGTDPAAWTDYQHCRNAQCRINVVADHDNPKDSAGRTIKFSQYAKSINGGTNFDFGAYYTLAQMPDVLRANWMAQNILNKNHGQPFFAACGIAKPHLPFIVPQQFYDLYPESSIQYPAGVLDSTRHTNATNSDTADIGAMGRRGNTWLSDHTRLQTTGEWKAVIRSYLAAITFTDHVLGILLDALLQGPNANNTYIVLWSDHGFQLGEKLAWRKFTLWERALRVPFMIAGPGVKKGNANLPVSLMDLYPTFADLALNQVPNHLQGTSLRNNLMNSTQTHRYALSSWCEVATKPNPGPHFSVRTGKYRYIRFQNGEQELYNHAVDPYEFNNLLFAGGSTQPTTANLRLSQTLRSFVPTGTFAPRQG